MVVLIKYTLAANLTAFLTAFKIADVNVADVLKTEIYILI